MLPEISLSILDLVQNSIKASASLIKIDIKILKDIMHVTIEDNGCGMSNKELKKSTDPFFTTRVTRKIGLGISFFKQASEITGGMFHIDSKESAGTIINATFNLNHIDCIPLGDINSTIHLLITSNNDIDFLYTYSFNDVSFCLDTREMRRHLDDIPLYSPEISTFIKEYLYENKNETDGGRIV